MLESMYVVILVGTLLVLFAAFSSLLAARFGAPLLLLFLGIGLLAGEDGLGLHFNDARLAYFVGSIALAIILFDSGIETPFRAFRQSAAPAVTLAVLGVPITAAIFGLAASYVLGLPLLEGVLLGAIVGSTDAAAVFFLLRVGGISVRDRVISTLEVESGSNDPMAIFLTITLVELLGESGGHGFGWELALLFAQQMGLGLAAGLGGGWVIARALNRLRLERGLAPIFALALAMLLFAATGAVEGSGFLAAYVAGLVVGNSRVRSGPTLRQFSDGMTWLAQIVMFLVLGLLATPSQFGEIALAALALAAVLIFVARPIAVWFCMLPFDFNSRETAFISWVGLRGSVSILLAIVPLIYGLDADRTIFNVAFIIVLASLLVQGWTIGPVAKWLGILVPPRIGPVEKVELELPGSAHHELLSYRVVPGSPVARGERLPRWARPSLVIRDGQSMRFQYAGRLQANDYVYLFVSPRYPRLLDRLFASPVALGPDDAEFFGDFPVDPRRPMRFLASAYDLALAPDDAGRPIGEWMTEALGGRAEYGDRVPVGPVDLVVRDTDEDGAIAAAGVALDPEANREAEIPLFLNLRGWWKRLRARKAPPPPDGPEPAQEPPAADPLPR
ncbi:potassium/proton antiporter [Aureimonas leprariae]|uniref:Potassium/proton antiporter n=1 Tax=Plantimonas leprariae TaxID=2615207 RepID=A0A7V7TVH4_9HYPH|nr:potassium/proton antiporter [Aureimonas leprariae]KAB0677997.1 potassium/proton antiporter [Aureimonas leprariae]